jgi:hypothetical protein
MKVKLYCYCSSNYTQPEIQSLLRYRYLFCEADGSIAVTNSQGATVVITNANNDVVANTDLLLNIYRYRYWW